MGERLSPQKVRRAIEVARTVVGEERPLSTTRFKTDGRTVFLDVLREDGSESMIDLFKSQYAFRQVIEPSLRDIEFDGHGVPLRWWPHGKSARIVLDPARSFGRPIEAASGVPAAILASAVVAEGSVEAAARAWAVSPVAVRRAVAFQDNRLQRQAA